MSPLSTLLMLMLIGCDHVTRGQAPSSRDSLRRSLSIDPTLSHARDTPIPVSQNVNVFLPVDDIPVQDAPTARVSPTQMTDPSRPSVRTPQVTVAESRQGTLSASITAGRPVLLESTLGQVARQQVLQPRPTASIPVMIENQPEVQFVQPQPRLTAPAPSTAAMNAAIVVVNDQRPVVNEQRPVVNDQRPVINDRLINNVRPIPVDEAISAKTECSFQIPLFLLPDTDPANLAQNQQCPSFLLYGPNIDPTLVSLLVDHWTGVDNVGGPSLDRVRSQITQVEFEQKCLVPALRAHVFGGAACKTRELRVYLEWLLYLRERLFNI
ncbi:uncharacterized protein LOC127834972 [Dreissena polymorpha]|uniref:Uncharacterized protein n=1 Tax=Dreissena polymorpha TaxID=45954 RepID=A0A9D4G204_DREPO|nr:uncharacterized protein LOC127834972 [Dreissena polymorpha]KAH3807689.1 hypothetical protein DPMN_136036 [Dreissena polymorpha]